MKYISLDIETTGLNPKIHDIIEFAAVMDNLRDQKPVEELPRFHAYIKKDNYIGEPYALSMHAEIFSKIANPGKEDNVIHISALPYALQNWLGRNNYPYDEGKKKYLVNVAGKNAAGFDLPFLAEKVKDWAEVQFRHRVLDPAVLYFDPNIEDCLPDSQTCMRRAGIVGNVKHTALEDSLMVVNLIRMAYRGFESWQSEMRK